MEPKWFNVDSVRVTQTDKHINAVTDLFKRKGQLICKAIDKLESRLRKIADNLGKKYGDNDEQRKIILKMVKNIQNARTEINECFAKKDYKKNYFEFRSELENNLKKAVSLYAKSTTISKQYKEELAKYHNPDSFKAKVKGFFNLKTGTVSKASDALEGAQDEIENALTFKPIRR